jgi:phytanoyl-CoA hydroxylase
MADQYADLVDQYHRDGFVILRNVIDDHLVKECQEHVDFLQKKYPTIPGEHLHHPIMRNDPFWVRVVSDQRLLDLAALFGTPFIKPHEGVALFSSHYFCKPARTGMTVLWHQDGNTLLPSFLIYLISILPCSGRCVLATEANERVDNVARC